MNGGVRTRSAPPNLHRIERPHALKIPARRAEYSLAENVASPFQAEPRRWPLNVAAGKCQERRPIRSGSVTTSVLAVSKLPVDQRSFYERKFRGAQTFFS